MATRYQEEFAHWTPIMRAKWQGSTVQARFFAKRDILATIELWRDQPECGYVGKLYAELDAIRDVELAEARKASNMGEYAR